MTIFGRWVEDEGKGGSKGGKLGGSRVLTRELRLSNK